MADKLIRDRIAALAAKRGVPLVTRRASLEEMPALLRAKLHEEVMEYLQDPCDEELADVAEVVVALSRYAPHRGPEIVQRAQRDKFHERGGFNEHVVLLVPGESASPPREEGDPRDACVKALREIVERRRRACAEAGARFEGSDGRYARADAAIRDLDAALGGGRERP